jgi:hypothetical protein
MDEVVRVGALARADPDPSEELAVWEADIERGRIDDPIEIGRRLDAYMRGEQVIVRLELFAVVDRGAGEVGRYDGTHVRGAWFETGAPDANIAHAREMLASHLDDFHRELTSDHALDVSYDALCDAPRSIQLDAELARRLETA